MHARQRAQKRQKGAVARYRLARFRALVLGEDTAGVACPPALAPLVGNSLR